MVGLIFVLILVSLTSILVKILLVKGVIEWLINMIGNWMLVWKEHKGEGGQF